MLSDGLLETRGGNSEVTFCTTNERLRNTSEMPLGTRGDSSEIPLSWFTRDKGR